jgi:hypothetical protein
MSWCDRSQPDIFQFTKDIAITLHLTHRPVATSILIQLLMLSIGDEIEMFCHSMSAFSLKHQNAI